MNLSSASEQFKKALVWFGIGLAALIAIWILWLVLVFLWQIIFPPKPPGPDFAFGQISKPFTYNFDPKNTTFEVGTPGGQLGTVTNILPVYAIPAPTGNFKSLENGQRIASGAGLDSEPVKLSEFEWRWGSKKQPNKSLQVNIVTNNFVYYYDWSNESAALSGLFKTTNESMISKAKSYLSTFNSSKADLLSGSGRVTYYKLVGKDFSTVTSFSEANAVRVELFRDGISYKKTKYPIFESNPNMSLVNLLIAPNNLLQLNFTYWNIDFTKSGTYYLKTTDEAYNDLRTGKATVPDSSVKFDSITITGVTLGYLNPADETVRYLQPVFNFQGNGLVNGQKKDFQAFVLAVKDDYIK